MNQNNQSTDGVLPHKRGPTFDGASYKNIYA